MPDDEFRSPNMGWILLLYLGTFVPLALIAYGVRLVSLKYLGDDFLAICALGFALSFAGKVAGTSFFRQSGRKASIGYSVAFGLIATSLIVAALLVMWLWGWPVPGLPETGPNSEQPWILPQALTTLLLIGEVCGFFIPLSFLGGTYNADRKHRAGLAAPAEE